MQLHLKHPADETVEEFLMHRMQEHEAESFEIHILACDSCLSRLEDLEMHLAATKMALAELHNWTVAKNHARVNNPWWAGLKLPSLSLACASATFALAMAILPGFVTAEITMSAVRGTEITMVPAGRPLLLHLHATDLPQGPVSVEVIDRHGVEIWSDVSTVNHNNVDAKLPQFKDKGGYLLRLYASGITSSDQRELLREFSFQVR